MGTSGELDEGGIVYFPLCFSKEPSKMIDEDKYGGGRLEVMKGDEWEIKNGCGMFWDR